MLFLQVTELKIVIYGLLFISNWIKSGILYVKDLFNKDGTILSEKRVIEKIIHKANWFSEYYKIMKIFKKLTTKYDTSLANFVKINKNWTLLHSNSIYCLKTQKSKFYYNIFILKKAEPNYMLKKWEKDFNLESSLWEGIYQNKIWQLKDKKLSEFNYKLLNNILCTKSIISKWNPKMNSLCPLCSLDHTVQHLLFECIHINNIWAIVGSILNINITYKHIIIGTLGKSEYVQARNLVINYIAYSIYKMWIMSENNIINLKNTCIITFIRKDLFSRTIYNDMKYFKMLCDKVIKSI